MTASSSPDYRHKEHPKRCDPDDFWGQVSRTIHGEPVDDSQIQMIVAAINRSLAWSDVDVLLDIGCGNGALANYFQNKIASYTGVDFSEYLISVARANFQQAHTEYHCLDAVEFVRSATDPARFTKVLCYGAFSYLSREAAREVLATLGARFVNVSRVFIGNLPDRALAEKFYGTDVDFHRLLDDRTAAIGIWRTRDEFCQLALDTGWDASFSVMPHSFYGAHYRYDVVLHRPSCEQ